MTGDGRAITTPPLLFSALATLWHAKNLVFQTSLHEPRHRQASKIREAQLPLGLGWSNLHTPASQSTYPFP